MNWKRMVKKMGNLTRPHSQLQNPQKYIGEYCLLQDQQKLLGTNLLSKNEDLSRGTFRGVGKYISYLYSCQGRELSQEDMQTCIFYVRSRVTD